MKMKFHYILYFALAVFFASCAKDNYDPPQSSLKGRIVYQGEPINVEHDQVRFQLWERGWGALTPIDVAVAQDGSFSALLFDANYKLLFPGGQGPFMPITSDSIPVDLKGSQTMDIEVIPYYMVRNPQFSASGRTVNASARLEQIITDANAKNVELVTLYINKTTFVGGGTNIARKELNGADITDLSNVALSVEVPSITPSQNYVFARIGVKIIGVEDMIFSPVERVQLN